MGLPKKAVAPDQLSELDQVAILLNLLGTQAAAEIFKKLRDIDVKRLIEAMGRVTRVPIPVAKQILDGYHREIAENNELRFQNKGREFALAVLGEERARRVLGSIALEEGSRTLEALELVDNRTLANFLRGEHVQTVALILAHLEPSRKGDVLKRLPESVQAEITVRLANLDFVTPALIAEVDAVLKQELATLGSIDKGTPGGIQSIVDMLNVMDKAAQQSLLQRLEEKDARLVEELRKKMFVFEDLVLVDDRGMQELLKRADQKKLTLALRGAPEELLEKIFRNLSKGAGKILRESIELQGPVRRSEVEKAQQELIELVKELETQQKLVIRRGGEGDPLV